MDIILINNKEHAINVNIHAIDVSQRHNVSIVKMGLFIPIS